MIPLTHVDNDFVENHPRFAKRNDVVTYKRILGEIRMGLYNNANLTPREGLDYVVEYGLAFIEGDYDNAGVWTQSSEVPSPAETGDEDDKWLFKNRVILCFGARLTKLWYASDGTQVNDVDSITGFPIYGPGGQTNPNFDMTSLWLEQESRQALMSTDAQLPMGSKVDVRTRRRSQYGEKLAIIARVETDNTDTIDVSIFCDHSLRVLVNG